MNRVFEPDESLSELPWPSAFDFGWPRNFRRFMFYSFAAVSVGFLALFLYRLPHLHSVSLMRLLVGPLFEFTLAAVSGIAAWTIWKAYPSAKGWAIAASLMYLSISVRPFLIPMRPVRDHNLISLVLGLVGLAAFAWPDGNDARVSLKIEAYQLTTDELLKRMPKEQAITVVHGILLRMEESLNVPDIPAAKVRLEKALEDLKRS